MAPIGAVAASVVSAASPSRCLASSLWGSRRSLRSLHSNDALCAHLSGLVPPLRRHTGFRTSRTHKPGPLLILAKKRSGFAELFLNKRCVATTRYVFCNFSKTQNHTSGRLLVALVTFAIFYKVLCNSWPIVWSTLSLCRVVWRGRFEALCSFRGIIRVHTYHVD